MPPYSRPQLWMLLGVVLLGGLGVAAGGWRRAHPDLVERVEGFDAAAPPTPAVAAEDGHSTAARSPSHAPSGGTPATSAPVRTRPSKVTAADGPVDLNRATRADLQRLPGVGPALAERIISAREDAGRFASVDDLRQVSGIGAVKLERLRPFVIVREGNQ